MGLQLYTTTLDHEKELQKCHAENDQIIIDYVLELKKCGYEIVEFPTPEKFRNYFIANIIVIPPFCTE